jgi:heme/copper-type cytochrome/quinol oxidase subunit 4
VQPVRQAYWNEYDDGSEAGDNDVYTIYVNPDAESTFPGAKSISVLFSKALVPMEKVKGWFSPPSTPGEQRPLIGNGNRTNGPNGYFTEHTETDIDDDAYASSSDFPAGYATHYATFPSVNDQKFTRERDKLLLQGTIGAFVASVFLTLIAGILVATGKHKLRVEVDAGVFAGVASSLFFATLGFAAMLYEIDRVGSIHCFVVSLVFGVICVVNSCIMVLVLGDTRL